MMKAADWRWLKHQYYSSTTALEEYPELQEIDSRLPNLMLQVQTAEALIDKIMKEASDNAPIDD